MWKYLGLSLSLFPFLVQAGPSSSLVLSGYVPPRYKVEVKVLPSGPVAHYSSNLANTDSHKGPRFVISKKKDFSYLVSVVHP